MHKKCGHARRRAGEGMADSVHTSEVLHSLDLQQHHHHNLGVQVEELHRATLFLVGHCSVMQHTVTSVNAQPV